MPTVEVWTVGTGGDYSTPQLAEDDLPASLVTADKQIDISLFNQEWASSSTTTFAGVAADSTRYLRVIADDPPDRRSLPLRYNTSAGPCIRETAGFKAAVVCSIPYTRWLNIQIKGEGEGLRLTDGTNNVLIDQCLVSATWRNIEALGTVSGLVIRNTAFIRHTAGGQQAWYQDFGSGTSYNNTIVRPSNLSVGGSGFYNSFFTLTVRNTVVTGFSSFSDATPGTSATNAGSMASVPGSGSLTSLTPSDLFEEPDNTSGALDLRLLSTSDLIGAGTDLSGSGVTTDYSGSTRPTPYDIGGWQYDVATEITGTIADTVGITGALSGVVLDPITGAITDTVDIVGSLLGGGGPSGRLRRRGRYRVWDDVPPEIQPVVSLAENYADAYAVERAVDAAIAKMARLRSNASAAKRRAMVEEVSRSIVRAVEAAAEADDEEALIALM